MFKSIAGINLVHVPYKGAGPATTDFLGGHVQVLFIFNAEQVKSHAKAGRLRAIALTGNVRSKTAPDVPTIAEAGYADYHATGWWGVVVPAATSKFIVAKLHADIVRLLGLPDVRERMLGAGLEVAANSPEQFAAFIDSELKKWTSVIRTANIQVD